MTIQLIDVQGAVLWAGALREASFYVGSAEDAQVVLPGLAERELQLVLHEGVLGYRFHGFPKTFSLDGRADKRGELVPGVHEVELEGHRLTLVVEAG